MKKLVFFTCVLLLSHHLASKAESLPDWLMPEPVEAAGPPVPAIYFPLLANQAIIEAGPHFTKTLFGIEMPQIDEQVGFVQVFEARPSFIRLNQLRWAEIEPIEGQRNWSVTTGVEEQLRLAAGRDIRVILVIRETPDWAQKIEGAICGPIRADKLGAFADFMHDLVARYSVAPYYVKYWEIYNEPDIEPELAMGASENDPFGCWGDPSDEYYGGGYYAEMLKSIYPKIKQADPEAQVLVGGLLMTCNANVGGCASERSNLASKFFEGILANDGGAFFDGVSFHSYDYYHISTLGNYSSSSWASFWNTTGPALVEKARYLKGLLEAYEISGKLVLNTETALLCGASLDPPGSLGCESDPASLYEHTKANYIVQSYAAAMAEGLVANIWYSSAGWRNSGLLNPDLSIRPGYTAFQFARSMLGGATFEAILDEEDTKGVDNLSGYSFRNPEGQLLWVVWSQDGQQHEVPFSKEPSAVWDALGNQKTLDQGELSITVEPVYILWDD